MSSVLAPPPPPPPAPPLRSPRSHSDIGSAGTGLPRIASQGSTLKVKRRSSKPILAWVQRKLAGSGGSAMRTNSINAENAGANELGVRASQGGGGGGGTGVGTSPANSRGTRQTSTKSPNTSPPRGSQKKSPISPSNADSMRRKAVQKPHHTPPPLTLTANKMLDNAATAVAASGDAATTNGSDSPKATSISFSMAAPGSTWSPSNPLEADDDASIRPLPPTSPPSPTPSRSTHRTASSDQTSGGYMSDPRTFRSIAASTKPTTLLSVEMGAGTGMAHIAQHPPSIASGVTGTTYTAPSSPTFNGRFSGISGRPVGGHTSGLSTTSITFSTLPNGLGGAGSPSSRHPLASAQLPEPDSSDDTEHHQDNTHITQAPNLTHHHPRNNPRPSSPPPDNASTLTLASSVAFNSPRGLHNGTPSIVSRFPSLHGYRGSSLTGGFGGGNAEEDPAASVRALRPRSRQGSWDSVASTETGWSAAIGGVGGMGRRKGANTVGSMRTGDEADQDEQDEVDATAGGEHPMESPQSGSASSPLIAVAVDGEDAIQEVPKTIEGVPASIARQPPANLQCVPITFTTATPNDSHANSPTAEVNGPVEAEMRVNHDAEDESDHGQVVESNLDQKDDMETPSQFTKTKFVEDV
ncbi:hypothetical protein FRB97_000569 [Tulasnella sp. 331]|nr:hypothetical protein FRB97_000569 [Tulasnella sp. 331]